MGWYEASTKYSVKSISIVTISNFNQSRAEDASGCVESQANCEGAEEYQSQAFSGLSVLIGSQQLVGKAIVPEGRLSNTWCSQAPS